MRWARAKRSIARDFAGSVGAQVRVRGGVTLTLTLTLPLPLTQLELNGLLELYKEGVGAAKQVSKDIPPG